ncbi:MAG: DnaJ domain-containing protein, partial [Acidobacteriota bacterium]
SGLARLWAIGLAEGPESPAVTREDAVVSAKILERFLLRIGEALELEPSSLGPAVHRERLAELIGRFGDLDHYQLLGVESTADDAAISAAYDQLARLAHPSHAAALGWSGKEGTLRLLFERATEAYLTLCDPLRRSSYNTLVGVHKRLEIDPSTRDEEKRFVARQNYLQASTSLAEADYSTAVDLMKEAVRIDPQAKYFAMLGQAQAKNPNWRRHAAESYRQATELAPDNAGYHLAFAKLLERLEEFAAAKEHYEATVDLMPDNVDALEALTRLRGSSGAGKAVTQSLRSVLGRRR